MKTDFIQRLLQRNTCFEDLSVSSETPRNLQPTENPVARKTAGEEQDPFGENMEGTTTDLETANSGKHLHAERSQPNPQTVVVGKESAATEPLRSNLPSNPIVSETIEVREVTEIHGYHNTEHTYEHRDIDVREVVEQQKIQQPAQSQFSTTKPQSTVQKNIDHKVDVSNGATKSFVDSLESRGNKEEKNSLEKKSGPAEATPDLSNSAKQQSEPNPSENTTAQKRRLEKPLMPRAKKSKVPPILPQVQTTPVKHRKPPSNTQVTIGRLTVEITPPPSEKAAAKSATTKKSGAKSKRQGRVGSLPSSSRFGLGQL